MQTVTNRIMSIIVTLLTTLLCFTGLQACEKGGYMFELGVRGDIKNPITQRTVEMVLETLKIGG